MKKFVSQLLPKGIVTDVAVGNRYYEQLEDYFIEHDVSAIRIQDNPNIDSRICGHVDMSLLNFEKGKLLCANYLRNSIVEVLLKDIGYDVKYINKEMGKEYPEDVLLNACITDYFAIYNKNTVDKKLVNYLTNKDPNTFCNINCKQGYSKCSVCVVNSNAIITSDLGIANCARMKGLDVLLIDDHGIRLDGFDHGFIGGASFKLSPKQLTLTGRFPKSQYITENSISRFLHERNIELCFASDEIITDIGGVIPLIEI
jgi:hypothetical protein